MRVLHIIDVTHAGGIGEFILMFYKHSKFDHQVKAYEGGFAPEMKAAGMSHWVDAPPKEIHFDVVVGHTAGGWSYDDTFAWAKERWGSKTVECMHSIHASPTNPAVVDGFISMSRQGLALNQHMPKAVCIHTMSNWVRRNHTYDVRLPVGRLSRVVPEKMPHVFAQVAAMMPSLKFLLGGDGTMLQQLKDLRIPNLEFAGWVRDFQSFYDRLGLFVFPTKDESCPMSLAMALNAGIPAIVQDTPALRETTNGLATFCNSASDFVDAIDGFYINPAPFMRLAEDAHDYAMNEFGVDQVCRRWEKYLEAVCES
jgi:glycosyltransferase involved in cell wall biosynthesis